MTLPEMQRTMAAALMHPAASRDYARQAAQLIKPGQRMDSMARLRIYQRSYWARLIDSLRDDFPGLISILGHRVFNRVAKGYLSECPSRSFTLRDLGVDLEKWLRMNRELAGENPELAINMAQLEWAHIAAFDGPSTNTLGPEDLAEMTHLVKVGLQPHLSLLNLSYLVDDLRLRANRVSDNSRRKRLRHAVAIQPKAVFLAVYRLELGVYYRRLAPAEFRLLELLRSGESIGAAIELAFQEDQGGEIDQAESIRSWFGIWAQLGWLTTPKNQFRGISS